MHKVILLFFIIGLVSCQTSSKDLNNKSPTTVILIGEAHNQDQKQIYAYLEAHKPHSVLLEIPVNLFHSPNHPQSEARDALEKNFIGWKYCQESGSLCSGFDILENDRFNKETRLPEREQKFINSFLKRLKSIQPSLYKTLLNSMLETGCETLQQRNSEICDRRVEEKRRSIATAVEELKRKKQLVGLKDIDILAVGEDRWQKRNFAMAQNICDYASELSGVAVVVIVGSEHRYLLKQLLSNCQVLLRSPAFND